MPRPKALKATRKSIKHWCIDIKRPLMKGQYRGLPIYAGDCALCAEYYGDACCGCPLANIGAYCASTDSAYDSFYEVRKIKNANNMIKDAGSY